METLLELKNVVKYFPIPAGGIIRRRYKTCKAVDDVSFSVEKGACFGIAGESGSGKTTIAKLILLLEKLTSGSILYEGKDVQSLTGEDLMWYRSSVQTIFQDAASSLNPRMRIKDIVSEPLEVQKGKVLSKNAIHARTEEILGKVGLGPDNLRKYPHELSGGQKQRVAIAIAIILEPSLVILDEPVSALDVSIRAQILNLLADIQEKENLTYVIIAHDLAMLEHITTHIAVMYLGKIVEIGRTEEVFSNPTHPYTKALFAAVPQPTPGKARKTADLKGEIGNPIDPPPGCRFHPRCPYAQVDCGQTAPALCDVGRGHQVACGLVAGISSVRP
jgi:oligopeptide/dipeptide ABC transporter ATP-binding protein